MSSLLQAILYECPTASLVGVLITLMLVANEVGFRVGRRTHAQENEHSRTVSNALKGSIFGLVALLLGFSFSSTTSRHEFRQRLVLNEANAAGTCYLRAGLLKAASRDRIRSILRSYVDTRIEYFALATDKTESERTQRELDLRLSELWEAVEKANVEEPDTVRNSLIVPAANEVIDLSSTRAWTVRNHLPLPVLVLLLVGAICSCLLLGHSSGQSNRRHLGLWIAMNLVLGLVLFIVLDYDRPRRGLIRVDHTPLLELKASFADSESSE